MIKKKFSLELASLTFFLTVGPIYWLPDLSSSALLLAKAGGLALFVLIPYLSFRKNIYSVPRSLPHLIFTTLVLAAPPAAASLNFDFLNYLIISLFIVLGYSLGKHYKFETILNSLYYSVIGFTIFCIFVFIDFIYGGIIVNPIHETRLYLYQTGFHGGRTGWTGICNLFLALALIGLLLKATGLKKHLLIFSAVILLLNLILVDSRGGLVTGLFVLLVFLVALGRDSKTKFVILSIILTCFSIAFLYQFNDRLLMSRTYLSITAPEELQTGITAGRTEGYLAAIDLYFKAPLVGLGEVNMKNFGQEVERIHNVWLRVLVEQGLFGFLALIFFTFGIFSSLFRNSQHSWTVYFMLLISGLLPTFFEPTGIFGNYFATALFWIVIGLLLTVNMTTIPQSKHKTQ